MKFFKHYPLLKMVNPYAIYSPQPSKISYFCNFGIILGFVSVLLYLNIAYVQLVLSQVVNKYPWLTLQFYSDSLQTLLNRSYNSLEWALTSPPKPYAFVSVPLQSNLNELNEIIASVNAILPQLVSFIDQFNNVVTHNNINVITDTTGNMSIDVPASMSEAKYNEVSKRIGIIDRIITTKGTEICDLFNKGLTLEKDIKANNKEFVSQLSNQIEIFDKINRSYKH